jgi:hypothetical protein
MHGSPGNGASEKGDSQRDRGETEGRYGGRRAREFAEGKEREKRETEEGKQGGDERECS